MHRKALVLPAIILTAVIGVLLWIDSGSVVAQKSVQSEAAESVTERRRSSISDRISSLVDGTGLTITGETLLPERYPRAKRVDLRIGQVHSLKNYSDKLDPALELSIELVSRQAGSVKRQRSFELTEDRIVILLTDSERRVLWWEIIADPRVLRAEGPDQGSELRGQMLYRSIGLISFGIADDEAIRTLHVFKPTWDGHSFRLDPLGEVSLAN